MRRAKAWLEGVVKIPMMPKGVEHNWSVPGTFSIPPVKIPMMPKGVEHEVVRNQQALAER